MLAWALAASALSCSPRTHEVGEVACAPGLCDAGTTDAQNPLPIGPPRYPDPDPEAFDHLAEAMQGVWSGITVTLDQISSVFELRFEPGEQPGRGKFFGTCKQRSGCVLFGQFTSLYDFEGTYRLWYVDGDGTGEGDLGWNAGIPDWNVSASWKMRNLLLRDMGEVLYFVLDSPAGGISVVLTRGPYVEVEADAGADIDAGDAGGQYVTPPGSDAALDLDAEASAWDGSRAP